MARDLWAWLGMRRTGGIERAYFFQEPRRAGPVFAWILSAEERRKGYCRPLRFLYTHTACRQDTRLVFHSAEALARDPQAYRAAQCWACRASFPAAEFVWKGSTERLGS